MVVRSLGDHQVASVGLDGSAAAGDDRIRALLPRRVFVGVRVPNSRVDVSLRVRGNCAGVFNNGQRLREISEHALLCVSFDLLPIRLHGRCFAISPRVTYRIRLLISPEMLCNRRMTMAAPSILYGRPSGRGVDPG